MLGWNNLIKKDLLQCLAYFFSIVYKCFINIISKVAENFQGSNVSSLSILE